MIHRVNRATNNSSSSSSSSSGKHGSGGKSGGGGGFVDAYNPLEEHDLEQADALHSSLWEIGIPLSF